MYKHVQGSHAECSKIHDPKAHVSLSAIWHIYILQMLSVMFRFKFGKIKAQAAQNFENRN
jgi:hypothetical protein